MYHLFEDEEQFRLTNAMEFHYIEMLKLLKAWKAEKLDPWNDVLARWLLLLGMVDQRNKRFYEDIYKELEEIAMEDKTLRKAFHHWEELSMTPEQFLAYETRLKHIMDEEAAKREAELRLQEVEMRAEKAEQRVDKAKQQIKEAESQVQKAENKVEGVAQ